MRGSFEVPARRLSASVEPLQTLSSLIYPSRGSCRLLRTSVLTPVLMVKGRGLSL